MDNAYHIPGVILLDGFSHSFAQGIILMQAYKYWEEFADDSLLKRGFVGFLMLLASLQTVLEDYKVWRLTIDQNWWHSSIQFTDIFLDGLIFALCEAFFVRRCWKFTKKKIWVLIPLCLLLLSTFVANLYLAIAVQDARHTLLPKYSGDTRDVLPSTIFAFSYWAFGSFVLTFSITSTLAFCLWRARTGFADSDKVLYQIIAISWESALPPSALTLTSISIYHANPKALDYYLVRYLLLITGKLYVIGLLRTLNSRIKLRERMKSNDLGRVSLSDWQWAQATATAVTASHLSCVTQVLPEVPPSVRTSADSRRNVASLETQFGSPDMNARERGRSRYAHSHADE